jgi:hypothetical protein
VCDADAIGDRQLAGADVLDIFWTAALGNPVGDNAHFTDLVFQQAGAFRDTRKVSFDLRFGGRFNPAVLHAYVEHERNAAFSLQPVFAGKQQRVGSPKPDIYQPKSLRER